MHNLDYSKAEIQTALGRMSDSQRIAFGASCCERMLPNYSGFRRETGWGDETPLRTALDAFWRAIDGFPIIGERIKVLTDQCEKAAPSSEAFPNLLTTAAQDGCFAVCSVLDYLSDSDVERIAQASSYAIDTIDLYVQELENMPPNDPQLESRIRLHPFMQREIRTQVEDIRLLLDEPNALSTLKQKWKGSRISLINIQS